MKSKFLIVLSFILLFSFSSVETQAQASKAYKLGKEIFKSIAKTRKSGTGLSQGQKHLLKKDLREMLESSGNSKLNLAIPTIEGGFYLYSTYGGGTAVCFAAMNTSNVAGKITFTASNEYYGRNVSYSVFLSPGESFYFGPPHGWTWARGEKMYITFSNGSTVYWQFF
jgi:hypothetical protein